MILHNNNPSPLSLLAEEKAGEERFQKNSKQ